MVFLPINDCHVVSPLTSRELLLELTDFFTFQSLAIVCIENEANPYTYEFHNLVISNTCQMFHALHTDLQIRLLSFPLFVETQSQVLGLVWFLRVKLVIVNQSFKLVYIFVCHENWFAFTSSIELLTNLDMPKYCPAKKLTTSLLRLYG